MLRHPVAPPGEWSAHRSRHADEFPAISETRRKSLPEDIFAASGFSVIGCFRSVQAAKREVGIV